jgi:hypothetical protein
MTRMPNERDPLFVAITNQVPFEALQRLSLPLSLPTTNRPHQGRLQRLVAPSQFLRFGCGLPTTVAALSGELDAKLGLSNGPEQVSEMQAVELMLP